MHGPAERLIKKRGVEYTIKNATSTGGRSSPSYSDDGTLVGVLEQRSRPTIETLSSGEAVESDLEIRAVYDSSTTTIRGQGDGGGEPTKLVHPDGHSYEVVVPHPEDGGVTVLMVVRD